MATIWLLYGQERAWTPRDTFMHHFGCRLAFMVSYPTNPQPTPRCSACQLQLCKGRDAPPHAALKVTEGGGKLSGSDTVYLCGVCSAVMIRLPDLL